MSRPNPRSEAIFDQARRYIPGGVSSANPLVESNLAFGGNKTRQLEFTVAEALTRGCDTLIQGAAAQSNHCRQAAAAAAKYGLECHLILTRDAHSARAQANLLLDHLLGAHIHWLEGALGEELELAKRRLAEEPKAQGKKP